MKNVLTTAATVLALTVVFATPASADVSLKEIRNEIRASVGGSSRIRVSESNGVVTLTGQYEDALDASAAMRVARNAEGVTKVINLAFQR